MSMEVSVDRRGFLAGGIGGNNANGTEDAETMPDPLLDVVDPTEFCDLWDV